MTLRSIRPLAMVAALALLVGACGSASAGSGGSGGGSSGGGSAGHASAKCGNASGRTLAASSRARVFSVGANVYGCSTRSSRTYTLGRRVGACFRTGRIGPVAVAGELVAYALARCGVDVATSVVIVRRLTNGQTVSTNQSITKLFAPESFQHVQSVVLQADGAVAWLASVSSVAVHRNGNEVHRVDRRGAVVLDTGPSIVPRSLRLHGSTLSWKDGGSTRTSTLR